MIISQSELKTVVERAARGRGLPYGPASLAGETARFLALAGLPALPLALTALAAGGSLKVEWREDGDTLRACTGGDPLSAVLAGPLVCGWLMARQDEGAAELGTVDCPAWLIAAAAAASTGSPHAFRISLAAEERSVFECRDGSVSELNAFRSRPPIEPAVLSMRGSRDARTPSFAAPAGSRLRGVPVTDGDWSRIEALAELSFVPASEDSRRHGAGFVPKEDDPED